MRQIQSDRNLIECGKKEAPPSSQTEALSDYVLIVEAKSLPTSDKFPQNSVGASRSAGSDRGARGRTARSGARSAATEGNLGQADLGQADLGKANGLANGLADRRARSANGSAGLNDRRAGLANGRARSAATEGDLGQADLGEANGLANRLANGRARSANGFAGLNVAGGFARLDVAGGFAGLNVASGFARSRFSHASGFARSRSAGRSASRSASEEAAKEREGTNADRFANGSANRFARSRGNVALGNGATRGGSGFDSSGGGSVFGFVSLGGVRVLSESVGGGKDERQRR